MIKSFCIKNLATIEEIEIDLEKGFSILTGETGAGKSIIIDGIRLVLGEKGSPDLIRTGKKETSVEAIFHFAQGKINLEGFPSDQEDELFISRTISEQGTGRGYINGVLVPIKKLKSLRNDLIDIYGQNDHVFLRHVEYQLDYLDFYADAIPLRQQVAQTAQELRRLIRTKRELEARDKEREQRLDFLNFQIKEMEKAELCPEEEEELRQERNILKNAEKITLLIETALTLAYEQENSVSSLLSKLQNVVSDLSGFDRSLKPTEEAIAQFAITIDDFSDSLIKFKEKQTASPERLEKLEERLSLIENLKRKYGSSITEILSYLEKAKNEMQELSLSHEKLADLGREIENTFVQYKSLCHDLAEKRRKSARKLEKAVEKEIGILGMKKARFNIDIRSFPLEKENSEKIRDTGTEEVEFLISPNPGEEKKPLRRIASGGELSRIMLALKSIGKETETLKTLIFDEIDSGIGGKTAEFVAQKLRDLAKQHQVICVTHLPQIASFAVHHFRIDKKIEKERTFTLVKKLSFEERVEEIARLLTGSRITETALNNAREMLTHNLELSPAG
ncbi:MAG: DNA repair protein RecN [Candidatus Aminicenantes bacterium]|nr:DNA repair protein RecN [Candidatus Aminicenantes bacterium]MDH5383597.1 DNA repair protein RecN [Candidatus Aminicenantes bacterium]MDH5742992.1 DNA repair protein RecN [Candidatus Aminicenantes bacterium]